MMATSGKSVLFSFIETGDAARERKEKLTQTERGADCLEPVGAELSPWLVIILGQDVVIIPVTQLDVRALELRRQWLERIRSAHGRVCGAVQGLFPRIALDFRLVGWHAALPHNLECQHDYAFLTELDRRRHDRKPTALHRNINPLEIALEVHSLRIREHVHAAVRCSTTAPAAPSATAAGKLATSPDRAGTGGPRSFQDVLNALVWLR